MTEKDVAENLEMYLSDYGFSVKATLNLNDGGDYNEREHYDVILTNASYKQTFHLPCVVDETGTVLIYLYEDNYEELCGESIWRWIYIESNKKAKE